MALEFSDWSLSPAEKVKSRKDALDAYINVAQPAAKAQTARERGQLADDTYYATQAAARSGAPTSGVYGKALQKAAEQLPTQAQREGEMAYAGAKMQEDIVGSRQTAAIEGYSRATEEFKATAAENYAKRAYEMGYNSKELVLSLNGYVADRGMQLLYKDLQEGRVSQYELIDLNNRLKADVQQKTLELQKELAEMDYKLKEELANKDFGAAKARIQRSIDRQKEIAQEAAEASNISAILSGVFGVGGALVAAGTGMNPAIGGAIGTKAKDVIEGIFNW